MKKKLFGLAMLASLLVALFPAVAAPANATGDYNFLMFSKSGITDPNPNQEDLTMQAALEEIGTVTLFDGGDGTAGAWTTALTGMDAVVFPEGDVYSRTDAMSAEAATVVKDWISAGGRAVGTGSYEHTGFIDYLTGIDRSDVWCDDGLGDDADVWTLAVASDTLPESILTGNYTGGICDWDTWSDAQKVGTTVLYANDAQNNMGIVQFAVGSGSFTYYAYDWYPDSSEADTVLVQWNEALRLGAAGTFEEAAGGGGSEPAFSLELELALNVGDTVAGAPVAVSASGLMPDSAWDLVLRSTPQTIDLGTVGADGLILSEVTIPAGLEPGWHSLTLTGTGADGISYIRVAHFLIAEDGTLGEAVTYDDVIEAALVNTGLTYALIAGETVLALLFAFAAFMAFGAKGRIRFAAMDERLAVLDRKLNRLYGSSRKNK